MKYRFLYFTLGFLFILGQHAFAQDENNGLQGEPVFTTDTVPELDLDKVMAEEEEDEKKKEKKRPKKVFYGMKTRKAFTKRGAGRRQQIELFYYLKKPADPNFYVPVVYVYDMQKREVLELKDEDKFDRRFHRILHGPYKKMVGGNVVEQGIFYIGTKHGRWEKYDREDTEEFNGEEVKYAVLLDKEKFYKGWPRETRVTYHDAARKKVKEVLPYKNGILDGEYYFFLENGQVFIRGTYSKGKKIGVWVEYFKDRARRRKETQYPESPYEEKEPFVLNEWDDMNNQIIVNGEKIKPGQKVETDPIKKYFKKKGRR